MWALKLPRPKLPPNLRGFECLLPSISSKTSCRAITVHVQLKYNIEIHQKFEMLRYLCYRLLVNAHASAAGGAVSYLQLIHPTFSHLNLVNQATSGEGRELFKRIVFVMMSVVTNLQLQHHYICSILEGMFISLV
jgi:hypothetical protein